MRDISYYGGKGALVTIKILPVDQPYGGSGVLSSAHPIDGGVRLEFPVGEPESFSLCEDGNIHSYVHQPFNSLSIQIYGHHREVGENKQGPQHLGNGITASYW